VLPNRTFYLPTFSHWLIVNKVHSLSLSLSLSLSHTHTHTHTPRLSISMSDDDDVFYLFLQKQTIALSHIPVGVLSTTEKKQSTCDDAITMTLMVQWQFFFPFWLAR
jgi:hypothetical protein